MPDALCPCGCGNAVKPGRKYAASGCTNRGRKLNLSAEERAARSVRITAYNRTGLAKRRPHKLNESAGARLAQRNRENWKDPEYRAVQTDRIRALQPRLTAGKKERKTAYWSDPERRKEQARITSERRQNPEFREKFFAGWLASFADRHKPSATHQRLKEALLAAGMVNYVTHVTVGHYCLDEADPSRKIAIEVNGCYWHACHEHLPENRVTKKHRRQRAQDKRKQTYLRRRGWKVIVVWEHELTDTEAVIRRITAVTEDARDGTGSLDDRH